MCRRCGVLVGTGCRRCVGVVVYWLELVVGDVWGCVILVGTGCR